MPRPDPVRITKAEATAAAPKLPNWSATNQRSAAALDAPGNATRASRRTAPNASS